MGRDDTFHDAERDPLLMGTGGSNTQRGDHDTATHPAVRVVQLLLIGSILLVAVVSAFETAFVVPPGMVGIIVTLGQVQAMPAGLHFRIPMVSEVEILSTKTQLLEEQNVIPTKEGLSVTLDTAVSVICVGYAAAAAATRATTVCRSSYITCTL